MPGEKCRTCASTFVLLLGYTQHTSRYIFIQVHVYYVLKFRCSTLDTVVNDK